MRANVSNVVNASGIMVDRAGHACTNILNQRSAEGDVEQLWPATNCKNWLAGLARGLHQRYLSIITTPVHSAQSLVPRLAVQFGIDVLAAGEQEPIDRLHYSPRDSHVCHRRHDKWYEP